MKDGSRQTSETTPTEAGRIPRHQQDIEQVISADPQVAARAVSINFNRIHQHFGSVAEDFGPE